MFISNIHQYSRHLIPRNDIMIGKKMRLFVPVRPSRRSSDEDDE